MLCKDCKKQKLCKFKEASIEFMGKMVELNTESPNLETIGAMFYCTNFDPGAECDCPKPPMLPENIWAGLHFPLADPPPFQPPFCREFEQSIKWFPNGPNGPWRPPHPPFPNPQYCGLPMSLPCGCGPRTHIKM